MLDSILTVTQVAPIGGDVGMADHVDKTPALLRRIIALEERMEAKDHEIVMLRGKFKTLLDII